MLQPQNLHLRNLVRPGCVVDGVTTLPQQCGSLPTVLQHPGPLLPHHPPSCKVYVTQWDIPPGLSPEFKVELVPLHLRLTSHLQLRTNPVPQTVLHLPPSVLGNVGALEWLHGALQHPPTPVAVFRTPIHLIE
uniref:Uncharacterized protein n=1 Tax=Lygus hesperus TaxID=30085 RepID=A0A146L2A7_LYGHE